MIFSHAFPASKTLTQQRSIDEAKIQTHQSFSSVCALSYLIVNRRTGCSPILNSFNCMNFLIFWSFGPKNLHIFCTCSEKLSQTRARRHNESMTGRHNGRIPVERSFACCLHGFCLLRLSQWKNLLFVQVD